MPDTLCHESAHLLSTAKNSCITEGVSVPLRIDIVKKSYELIVRANTDDVGNDPSVSAGAPNH